jgi:hypothetical protein
LCSTFWQICDELTPSWCSTNFFTTDCTADRLGLGVRRSAGREL